MTDIYEIIRASGYDWIGWLDIENLPPRYLHVLVIVKNWGPATGILLEDDKTFRFTLPTEESTGCLEVDIGNITHWHPIPELLETK